MKKIIISIVVLALFPFQTTLASEREIEKARVVEILSSVEEEILAGVVTTSQTLEIEFLKGPDKGKRVSMINDYVPVSVGDTMYVAVIETEDGPIYSLYEMQRMPVVIFFIVVFLVLTFIFGGLQGVRAIASLVGSLALIIYVLLPGIIGGASPALVGIAVASAIIIFGSYVTHGFNRTTTAAVISMIITVVITGILASIAINMTNLNGMAEEETLYLAINLGRSIDLLGLLMAGVIIGLLGVLYDTAISQAISVEELLRLAPKADKKYVYKRALRMGREHIGALINTLAIAYVGASLPLFLLFYADSSVAHGIAINNEIFVAEILRTIVGGIGVILAVPITTFLAIQMLYGREFKDDFHGHSHSHGHHH